MKKLRLDYYGFLQAVCSGIDDTDMTPKEIVEYMSDKNEMPEGVNLWEPLENDSPAYLVKNGLGYIEYQPEVIALVKCVKALGKAIMKGDPQDIADRWMNTATAIKELE